MKALILSYNQNAENMTMIIFKNSKSAKTYNIYSTKDQGIYKKGEFIRSVKTDNIEEILSDGQYQTTATEIK